MTSVFSRSLRTKSMIAALASPLVFSAIAASATPISYTSETAFATATGATLHSFAAGQTATSLTSIDSKLTLSTVGVTGGNMITDWGVVTGVSRLPGVELAISGVESFNATVQFSEDRYSFGFGYYESTDPAQPGCNTTCFDSTFTITLMNNGIPLIPAYTLSPADNVAGFWGIQTNFAFDGIQIRETTGSNDNEIFGTFYTGTTPVPEPASLALLGLGLTGLGFSRRKKK